MLEPITATILAGGKLAWDAYGEEFTEWLKSKTEDKAKEKGLEYLGKGWDKVKWHQAEQEYKEKLAKLYGTTRILGNSEPTPLEGIFTDLYILDKPLAMRRYSLDDLQASDEKLRGHELQRCEGIAVVKQPNSHRLFILGKPGAGKTTFLKYITLQAVKGELSQTPIFVSLYDWSTSNETLMEFIVEQFAICNFPKADSFIEYLLEKGRAILLLDGLDEVNNEYNQKVIKEVKNFCRKYDETQCLITCRVAAADYSFEYFKYMEVADFTDVQIETFVKKWFAKEPIKCEKFLTEFQQEQYRGLRELACSPLLLGMLCLAFADSMEFTTRRVDIYEDAIDALLRKWDSSRSISRDIIYKGLNHHLKKQVFRAIAYKTFSDNKYLIEENQLVDYLTYCLKQLPNTEKQEIDGEVVLKAVEAQHGIFVERAQKIHSFAHLTFQEYFAACAIKNNPNYQKELMKHITNPRWREVFLLTASLLDDADNFFNFFISSINKIIEIDTKIIDFIEWINTKESQINPLEKNSSFRVFYIFISLDRALSFDLNLSRDKVLKENIYIAHNLNNKLSLNIKVIFDFDLLTINKIAKLNKNIACDYLMIVTLLMVLSFTASYRFEPAIKYSYSQAVNFFDTAIEKLFDWKFSDLAKNLSELKEYFPKENTSAVYWIILADKLKHLLKSQCNIYHDWQLSEAQLNILSTYLSANSLLLDCLELATVSDREAIKNSLFLPPANNPN